MLVKLDQNEWPFNETPRFSSKINKLKMPVHKIKNKIRLLSYYSNRIDHVEI
jgi:hypothetical protein